MLGSCGSPLRRLLRDALAIAAVGAALGLLVNALHPMGLPLVLGEVEGPAIPTWVWRKVSRVDAAEARRVWDAESALFVDTRNPDDFAAGHIPRSLSLPYHQFSSAFPTVAARLPHDRPLVIYCYGSSCGLSMRLAKRLLREGHGNLIVLEGGLAAWERAGYPLTSKTKARQR